MLVIITGASKGLGKAIAEKFAGENNSILCCARNEKKLFTSCQNISTRFPQCIIKGKKADLSLKSDILEFGEWCLTHGTPDIVVNNAGQFLSGSIYNETDGILEKMIEVNLYSAYHLTRVLLPKMITARKGHIFNMCSIAATKAYENGGSYSISKYAMLGFSKNLREEMKPYNIKVTAVMPGAVYTDSWSGSGISQDRIMEVNDIAELIYVSSNLSPQACVEEIIVRPQLGDL